MRLKETLRYFVPLLGSSVVLIVLLRQIDGRKILWAAQHFNPWVLALVILLGPPFVLLKAFKWHLLLRVAIPEASYRLALRSFLLGMTASLITPGRLGELARAACFPGKRTPVLALTLMDKLIDVTVLLTLCAMSLWAYSTRLGIIGITGGVVFAASIWVGPQWMKRWPPIHPFVTVMPSVSGRLVVLNGVLAICCYALLALQFHLLLSGLHPVPLWVSSTVLPPILLGSALPLFINGLGGREGIATVLLKHYAVPGEQAVLASFLLFVVSGLLPGGVGIVSGLKVFRRGGGLKSC